MLRQLISYMFIALLMFQTVQQAIIITDYLVEKEMIAQKFCENKDKPKLHCDGKCHLAKQLKETKPKQQEKLNINSDLPVFVLQAELVAEEEIVSFIHEKKYPISQISVENKISKTIFHPPCIA